MARQLVLHLSCVTEQIAGSLIYYSHVLLSESACFVHVWYPYFHSCTHVTDRCIGQTLWHAIAIFVILIAAVDAWHALTYLIDSALGFSLVTCTLTNCFCRLTSLRRRLLLTRKSCSRSRYVQHTVPLFFSSSSCVLHHCEESASKACMHYAKSLP
jgi:hypothetical protein